MGEGEHATLFPVPFDIHPKPYEPTGCVSCGRAPLVLH
jgi:hypothetical protein